MKEFVVGKNDAGQRLDRWLSKAVPLLPSSLAQKYIRIKRVKCNGKGARRDTRLQEGDLLELYINDEFFDVLRAGNAYLSIAQPKLTVLYEDEDILLCDKPPGLLCHPDRREYTNTLITHIQAYLYQKKEWNPRSECTFIPSLCNRIDRNTGGIVIAAKNAESLRVLNQKIRAREVDKRYLAVIPGEMTPPAGTLEGYITRDPTQKKVTISQTPDGGGKFSATEYRTLTSREGLSLLECRLLTGRTHQIRSQLAAVGHPLLGDIKYGNTNTDMPFQALYAYQLSFRFTSGAGPLDRLNGRSWQVEQIDFVQEYFPGFSLKRHCLGQ